MSIFDEVVDLARAEVFPWVRPAEVRLGAAESAARLLLEKLVV